MANIKIRNKYGQYVNYDNVNNVVINNQDSGTSSFITTSGNKEITNTSITDVASYATAQVVDANLVSGNIKQGVSILGINGSFSYPVYDGTVE